MSSKPLESKSAQHGHLSGMIPEQECHFKSSVDLVAATINTGVRTAASLASDVAVGLTLHDDGVDFTLPVDGQDRRSRRAHRRQHGRTHERYTVAQNGTKSAAGPDEETKSKLSPKKILPSNCNAENLTENPGAEAKPKPNLKALLSRAMVQDESMPASAPISSSSAQAAPKPLDFGAVIMAAKKEQKKSAEDQWKKMMMQKSGRGRSSRSLRQS